MPSPAGWAEVPCARCGARTAGIDFGERCPACAGDRDRRARKLAHRISLAGAVLFFGYAQAGVEAACLPSAMATTALLATLVTCLVCAAVLGRRRRALRSVTFEPVSESFSALRPLPALD